ncbi:MAG TPA: aminoglycoside phosphotransferase family protein [Candidatus Limnocylindria bacterium]|nr:aminoglycoside phosphotransferase family protein [Candidatus Limnocylindria bacterium]
MTIDREATARRRRALTADELERLRARIDPSATRIGARPLVGGLDTATYRVTLGRGPATSDVVVRIYREYEHDAAEAVRREYAALTAVSAATVLAPKPILADASGEVIGDPLIVMSFFPGAPLPPSTDADEWVQQMADGLVAVHATPLDQLPAHFRRGETPAERVARIVGSPPKTTDALWDEVAAVLPRAGDSVTANASTLIHGDYWFGNTIWLDGRLTGIIDWDDARIADPALDVSIARNDIVVFSGPPMANLFLAQYERARGPLAGLVFWDLVACLSPIKWLAGWVEGYQELGVDLPLPEARARLEAWVASVLARLDRVT